MTFPETFGSGESLLLSHSVHAFLWCLWDYLLQFNTNLILFYIKHIVYSCCVFSHSVMSDSLSPMGYRPPDFSCSRDFPGKNTGVGCHFLLQRISRPRDWTQAPCTAGRFYTIWSSGETLKTYQFSSVAQSCLTLCDPMNRSMPGLPVYHQLDGHVFV